MLVDYVFNVFNRDPDGDHPTRILNQIQRVTELFETGIGNKGQTAWDAYNAVTQWLNYERGNSVDTRLNSLWFGDSAKLSKRALDCALAL
jgi:hypothetical protein